MTTPEEIAALLRDGRSMYATERAGSWVDRAIAHIERTEAEREAKAREVSDIAELVDAHLDRACFTPSSDARKELAPLILPKPVDPLVEALNALAKKADEIAATMSDDEEVGLLRSFAKSCRVLSTNPELRKHGIELARGVTDGGVK